MNNPMTKFQMRPIMIEAIQVTDSTFDAPHPNTEHIVGFEYDPVARTVRVRPLNVWMIARVGDWIIKDANGQYRVCERDDFDATYEPIQEAQP